MRVLVYGNDVVALRAAASLAAHPDIAAVGLADANPPAGWGDRMTRQRKPSGFDVVVGRAARHVRSVTAGPGGTVNHASPTGLARALAARLGDSTAMAVTVAGKPRRSTAYFDFPPPVGRLLVTSVEDGVGQCATEGALAAVGAADAATVLSIVDHPPFLQAVCLAAAVLLHNHQGPVWDRGGEYLERCEQLGLVQAMAPLSGE